MDVCILNSFIKAVFLVLEKEVLTRITAIFFEYNYIHRIYNKKKKWPQ